VGGGKLGLYMTFPSNPNIFSCIFEQLQRFYLTREILSHFSPFDFHVWQNPDVSGSFYVAHYSKNSPLSFDLRVR
jgi:hypothetical protein